MPVIMPITAKSTTIVKVTSECRACPNPNIQTPKKVVLMALAKSCANGIRNHDGFARTRCWHITHRVTLVPSDVVPTQFRH